MIQNRERVKKSTPIYRRAFFLSFGLLYHYVSKK
jgi:hypothetical protein